MGERVRIELAVPAVVDEQIRTIAKRRGYVATTGRTTGQPDRTRTLVALVEEEHARGASAATLFALAQSDADKARALIEASMALAAGNVTKARALLGEAIGRVGPVHHEDWSRTIRLLGVKPGKKEQSGT